jgi:hypothetical protein
VIAWQLDELVPQPLPAVTHTVPDELPKSIVADLVPCPAVIVAPAGNVHVYKGVPATNGTE